jgi:hypothetical protein
LLRDLSLFCSSQRKSLPRVHAHKNFLNDSLFPHMSSSSSLPSPHETLEQLVTRITEEEDGDAEVITQILEFLKQDCKVCNKL